MTQELVLERPQELRREAVHSSTLKTILVHVQNDENLDGRIEAALSLARGSSAHVSLLHATPIQAYVVPDSLGGVFVMNDVMKSIDEADAKLRSRVEAKMRGEDVSWDYQQSGGDVELALIDHAALADLVVVGRTSGRGDFILGDLLQRSRSPLFIPGGESAIVDPTGVAVIAWNGSYEAANAVRSSIGLLKIATSVRVIAEERSDGFPSTRLLEYLARQGISAELTIQQPQYRDDEFVAAALVEYARSCGAAYLVMGGYSHSRVREYVFGGVTRTLLKACPVSLVIAH